MIDRIIDHSFATSLAPAKASHKQDDCMQQSSLLCDYPVTDLQTAAEDRRPHSHGPATPESRSRSRSLVRVRRKVSASETWLIAGIYVGSPGWSWQGSQL